MKINSYILKLCGVFDFSLVQRNELIQNEFFEKVLIDKYNDFEKWKFLSNQYYPSFRQYLTNEAENNNFKALTVNKEFLQNEYKVILKSDREIPIEVLFSFDKIEVFLFEKNPGVVALSVSSKKIDYEIYTSLVSELRNYSKIIIDTKSNIPMSVLDFIEKLVYLNNRKANLFITKKSKIDEYRGPKLKVFQVLDFETIPVEENLKKLLFEIATLMPPYSYKEAFHAKQHSVEYTNKAYEDSINVFNNWIGICLFDTFSIVSSDYVIFKNTQLTWDESYFRIYIYNLYIKYYLFAFNTESFLNTRNLKRERREFYDFLHKHTTNQISYNFLPNLLHKSIKKGFFIQEETNELQGRLDKVNGIKSEENARLLSLILFVISVITLLPSNWGELIGRNSDILMYNRLTLLGKIFFVLLSILWGLKASKKFKK